MLDERNVVIITVGETESLQYLYWMDNITGTQALLPGVWWQIRNDEARPLVVVLGSVSSLTLLVR